MPTFYSGDFYPIQQPCPAEVITNSMLLASYGMNPSLGTDEMLEILKLDGDEADGLTLMDRFVGDGQPDFRSILFVMAGSAALLELTNERRANPAEESVAKSLGAVVTRQVVREGDICPGARAMVLKSERDDIISPDVRAKINAIPDKTDQSQGNRFTRRIPGMSLFRNRRQFGDL